MFYKCNTPSWPSGNKGIYHRAKQGDQIVNIIKSKKLYIKYLGKHQHLLYCPFHDINSGIKGIYTEQSKSNPNGKYNCERCVHCFSDPLSFYDRIGAEYWDVLNLSMVKLENGKFSEIIDIIDNELGSIDNVFHKDGKLIILHNNNNDNFDTIKKKINKIYVEVLNPEIIRMLISRRCAFFKQSTENGKLCRVNMPYEYCNSIYKINHYHSVRELYGVTSIPLLKNDGSILMTPGYDSETKMFCNFNKDDFHISYEPTRQDAEKAILKILDLLSEFPFASEVDKSVAVSAIFTSTIRISLPVAPMYHGNGSQIASGKTYIMKCISAFATPYPVASVEFPSSNDECGKQLLSLLRKGTPVVFFDNATRDLQPYQSLCSILTDEFFSARILGQSEISEVSTRALILSNGNNVVPQNDLLRRVVEFVLLPTCEIPATRTFDKDPLSEIQLNRAYYVSLVLTMIRAWVVAGRPEADVPPVASYADWSSYCRQVLLWLGLPDPAESLFRSLDNDPDRKMLGRFLLAWFESFNNQSVKLRDACNNGNAALKEVFIDINGGSKNLNPRRIGKWLGKRARRTVDGLTLEQDKTFRHSVEAWRVISR